MTKLALVCLAFGSLVSLSTAGCASQTADSSDDPTEDGADALRRGSSGIEGTAIDPSDIADALRTAGVPAASIPKLVCTSFYESRWHDRSWNWRNSNGTIDRGLFQINSAHLKSGGLCADMKADDLWDIDNNAECASRIFKEQGLNAWYGYRSHRSTQTAGGYRYTGCDSYKLGDPVEKRL